MKEIQKASPQDILGLQHLLVKANEYSLHVSNRRTWEHIEKAHNAIEREVHNGNVFVIRNNDTVTASITFSETNDEWGELGQDGNALYFMKFMKDPNQSETDEAKELLRFVAEEAERKNKLYIRCDALMDIPGIVAYYKRLGFQERGRFFYKPNIREGVLLETLTTDLLQHLNTQSTHQKDSTQ